MDNCYQLTSANLKPSGFNEALQHNNNYTASIPAQIGTTNIMGVSMLILPDLMEYTALRIFTQPTSD